MNLLQVDVPRFAGCLPPEKRREMARLVHEAIGGRADVNQDFFGHLDTYHHQPFYNPALSLPDLYSPNICAIDFALSHLTKRDLILDWGCGLGICGQYLRQLGFPTIGYDAWKQLPREVAERFQANFKIPLTLVDDFRQVDPTVVMHVSIWLADREAWDRPSVKWILSDTHYVEGTFDGPCPPGFEIFGQYTAFGRCKDYLTVFRRTENARGA